MAGIASITGWLNNQVVFNKSCLISQIPEFATEWSRHRIDKLDLDMNITTPAEMRITSDLIRLMEQRLIPLPPSEERPGQMGCAVSARGSEGSKMMKIIRMPNEQPIIKGDLFPMELMNFDWAVRIHDQSLERLNARGGMTLQEIVGNLYELPLDQIQRMSYVTATYHIAKFLENNTKKE